MKAFMVLNKKNLPLTEPVKVELFPTFEEANDVCNLIVSETSHQKIFRIKWDDLAIIEINLTKAAK